MIFRRKAKLAKWKFKEVYAVIIHNDHTWSATRYDPNETLPIMVPEPVQPYMHDYRYIMSLKGWIPLTKYDGAGAHFKAAIKRLLHPKRTGLIIFHEAFTDGDGKLFPISHAAAYKGEYDAMTPEFLKKVCESRLAANFSRSLDKKQLKLNWIIIAIVVMVVLGVLLKVTGAL